MQCATRTRARVHACAQILRAQTRAHVRARGSRIGLIIIMCSNFKKKKKSTQENVKINFSTALRLAGNSMYIMKSTWKVHNPRVIILLMCSQLSYFKRLFEQDSGHLVQHDNNYYTIDHTIS